MILSVITADVLLKYNRYQTRNKHVGLTFTHKISSAASMVTADPAMVNDVP